MIDEKLKSMVDEFHRHEVDNRRTVQSSRHQTAMFTLIQRLYLLCVAKDAVGKKVDNVVDSTEKCSVCSVDLYFIPPTQRHLNFAGNTTVIVGAFCEACAVKESRDDLL